MALIRNETNPTVVTGIENLTHGVWEWGSTLLFVEKRPFKSRDSWLCCCIVTRSGTIVGSPQGPSWENQVFTLIAPSFDLVVPSTTK